MSRPLKQFTSLTFERLEDRLVPVRLLYSVALADTAIVAPATRAANDAFVRVNQVGYTTDGIKQARLMTTGAEAGASFRVIDAGGNTVFTADVGAEVGSWSATFSYVFLLDFSAVTTPGTYTIQVDGPLPATSPAFQIDTAANLYDSLLSNALFYFEAQHDGRDVDPTVLNRQPSHLADENAFTYRKPQFQGGRLVVDSLVRLGGRIDASGGWFDAGDYLKFVQTASYTAVMMLVAVRDHPGLTGPGSADFLMEARFGLDWLLKMWNDDRGVLYYQVGIASGDGVTVLGDHDAGFRLPEADDLLDVQAGDPEFFIKFRPVFRANAPGALISPNLAGRVAAAFALGSQVFRDSDPAYADRLLRSAQHIFDLAKRRDVTKLLTASPFGIYAETEWREDIELAATELFFATSQAGVPADLPHTDPMFYLTRAAKFAAKYIARPDQTIFLSQENVSSLAHYELVRAIRQAGNPAGLPVTEDALIGNIKAKLDAGVGNAFDQQDPFGFGARYEFSENNAADAFGFVLQASFYKELTGDNSYDQFAADQLGWVLGDNAWGASFLVGAGTTFTHCLHHQIANLSGSLDGTPPVLLGAVVNGPGDLSNYDPEDLGTPGGANPCPADGSDFFAIFTARESRYRDNVDAFRSTEPADDYTVPTVLLFARLMDP